MCILAYMVKQLLLIVHECVLSHVNHVQLFVTPMGCSPPGSSIHGISQARILKWVAIYISRGPSQLRDGPWHPHCRRVLYHLSHQGSSMR